MAIAAVVSHSRICSPIPKAGKIEAVIAAAMIARRKRSIGIRGSLTPAS